MNQSSRPKGAQNAHCYDCPSAHGQPCDCDEAARWPKIFIYAVRDEVAGLVGFALAEDGTGLAAKALDAEIYARADMGIDDRHKRNRAPYDRHYPAGYVLVDLIDKTDAEVLSYPDFAEAHAKHMAEIIEAIGGTSADQSSDTS